MKKQCTKCKVFKVIDRFSPDKRRLDGRQSHCKDCRRIAEIHRRNDLDYQEYQNQERRQRYQSHIEEERAGGRAYYQKNRERILEYQRQHKAQRNERLRRRRREHPEVIRALARAQYAANPTKQIMSTKKRRALLAGATGSLSVEEWDSILEKHDYKCLACGSVEYITMDHITPLSVGGTHEIINVQPLCRSCNSKKGANYIDYRPDAYWFDWT